MHKKILSVHGTSYGVIMYELLTMHYFYQFYLSMSVISL